MQMVIKMNEEWISQIKRGTLEYAIILILSKGDRYGYELIQMLEEFPMLKTKESTIYPLLRRLMKKGCLESYWKNMEEGTPPRKYYKITENGILYAKELDKDWSNLINSISEIKRG